LPAISPSTRHPGQAPHIHHTTPTPPPERLSCHAKHTPMTHVPPSLKQPHAHQPTPPGEVDGSPPTGEGPSRAAPPTRRTPAHPPLRWTWPPRKGACRAGRCGRLTAGSGCASAGGLVVGMADGRSGRALARLSRVGAV